MTTASPLSTSKLGDPFASKKIQQSKSSSSTIFVSNQETDHISVIPNRPNLIEWHVSNSDGNYNKWYDSTNPTLFGSRLRMTTSARSKDVIDNKTDNFLNSRFCNIKRMSEIYCKEHERLKTFQDWPLEFIDKEILAKTGFFYTGDDDKVRCYFCDVEIGRWEVNDNPISEHTRWSPNCPLLRRRSTTNEPIDEESLNRILPPVSYDVCGVNDIIEVRPNAYAEGSISPTSPINSLPNTPNSITSASQTNFIYPDHPEYMYDSARLRSFGEWPRTMKQKPEQLAEAGFFYTGVGDRVKCFSCGGGLKDWDENDDPWEQHALWLSNCHYLKLMKGTAYIESIAEKFKTIDEESKELGTNENQNLPEGEPHQHLQNTNSNISNNNNNENEIPSIPSTSSSSLNKGENEGKLQNIASNSNNNEDNKLRSANSDCSSSISSKSTSTCSDEDNCSESSSSESGSSVNSNSSKEAETVCKQPKLDSHHHHISKNLQCKKSTTISEEKLCKICYGAEYNTAFLPCGHVVACAKCACSVTKCPMCRKPFTDIMRVYFS